VLSMLALALKLTYYNLVTFSAVDTRNTKLETQRNTKHKENTKLETQRNKKCTKTERKRKKERRNTKKTQSLHKIRSDETTFVLDDKQNLSDDIN
jgi:hypothetical protein